MTLIDISRPPAASTAGAVHGQGEAHVGAQAPPSGLQLPRAERKGLSRYVSEPTGTGYLLNWLLKHFGTVE